jgi:hypothetical protein
MKGENPLAAKLAAIVDTTAASMDGRADAGMTMMEGMPPAGGGDRPRAAMRRAAAAPPVQLSGLAQVVGLAIGAPEFQRR